MPKEPFTNRNGKDCARRTKEVQAIGDAYNPYKDTKALSYHCMKARKGDDVSTAFLSDYAHDVVSTMNEDEVNTLLRRHGEIYHSDTTSGLADAYLHACAARLG